MESQLLKIGGTLYADSQIIICRFTSPRVVVSTSLYNGGYLTADAVFNQRLSFFVNSEQDLPGGSMANYLRIVAEKRGLDSTRATGLLTNARMHCRGYSMATYNETIIEVVATAGVDGNAVRAGDAACYVEHNGEYLSVGGTINIIALTNVNLPPGTMAKALISITEAKTAVLQELSVVSPFTGNQATGTGTDGIILACNPASTVVCSDVGTQSKLGELFCRTVKDAVSQSLAKECNRGPQRQGAVHERMNRLRIDVKYAPDLVVRPSQARMLLAMAQSIWQEYCWGLFTRAEVDQFFEFLKTRSLQPEGSIIAAELTKKMRESKLTTQAGGAK